MKATDSAPTRPNPTTWQRTVKVGNTAVKIYRSRRCDGAMSFQVADFTEGRRRLRTCATLPEAEAVALDIAAKLATGQTLAAQMDNRDAAAFGQALETLRPTGDALLLAASRYAEAVAILGDGARLADACRFYVARTTSTPRKTVEEAVAELVAHKAQIGISPAYAVNLRSQLAKLAAAFPHNQVADVTTADVQRWLDAMRTKPQTVANFRRAAATLFSFCASRGYIKRGENPVTATEAPKIRNGTVTIYTPKELAALLAHASPRLLPALALAAFCGLRTAEILRLEWRDVDTAAGFVTVAPEKAKTACRRIVPILPNLAAWLAPYRQHTGTLWPISAEGYHYNVRATAAAAGVKVRPNALRHSFASYRLAQIQSAAQVALEMGNSPAIVFAHYRELVRPTAALAWFAVAPEAPANVTTITDAMLANQT